MQGTVPFLMTLLAIGLTGSGVLAEAAKAPIEISGRYPSLATFNHQGECGTGAVVPWADRLWVITYAPHKPKGSDDKLWEILPDLSRVARPESVGGTPANRLIHRESNQLNIGPYLIDAQRNVRVISPEKMPGRFTATARHLTDPANKIYIFDMEGALFEVDVHTLAVKKRFSRVAPGAHGKGAYTSQGRLVVANNGNEVVNKAMPALEDPGYKTDPEASGILAEWDGKTWTELARREFTDITGPGGINGAPDDKSPLWAIGWDKRSVLLKLLDGGTWQTFRLPIADYSYMAKHGWYTEWPRIREVAPGKLLMNMHGQWFEFPETFSAANTGGIKPIGCYQKITGDFCGWQGRVVFGCDDASIMENPLLGQSQSNLWFTTWEKLADCGRPAGFGGPWVGDHVKANQPSDPYLFAGYAQRCVHISHDLASPVTFTFETDADGHGKWMESQVITVPAHGYAWHVFPAEVAGQWIRVKTNVDCPKATVYFHYGPGGGAVTDRKMFDALADAGSESNLSAGTLRPLGADAGSLFYSGQTIHPDGSSEEAKPLELKEDLHFADYTQPPPANPKAQGAAAGFSVKEDPASLILTYKQKRYRLPVSNPKADVGTEANPHRYIREIVTERFLVNAGGSLFVLPRITSGGAQRIKPLCTHDKCFTDFCSWRAMLAIAGTKADAPADGHYFATADKKAGLWLGDIDDLWKLGKPRGHGGPLLNTPVELLEPSDPYLMAGYDRKTIHLSHDSASNVRMVIEVDFSADDTWHVYGEFDVPPGQTLTHEFPLGFSAHWVRVSCSAACQATAQLEYE
jgi:hypothetical protein